MSTQLGTNTYFVNNVLQPFYPCGAHSTLNGQDMECSRVPCACSGDKTNPTAFTVLAPDAPPSCSTNTTNVCLGTKIPFEQALTATFIEGLVFLAICFTGLRFYILKLIPKQILLAGACGIGIFISFVGFKDSGFITQAPYPTLLRLNLENQYVGGPIINMTYHEGPRWNDCVMYFNGPPFGAQCNWLALGGLIFTGILMVWQINGALIMGILFTTFIAWIKFPQKYNATPSGLLPPKFAAIPKFTATAGALDFNWGDNTGTLIGALLTFLYLDFIGSAITFAAMGTMSGESAQQGDGWANISGCWCDLLPFPLLVSLTLLQPCPAAGMLNERGEIPKSNLAFIADGLGSTLGGLLGSSALTTYVESAAAVREGGRTGITSLVCACLFFLSCFFYPWTGYIPTIATGPILLLIGVVIFVSAVYEVNWKSYDDSIPAYLTMLVMPFTHNISYGVIAGWIGWVIAKFFSFKLVGFPLYQEKWPGAAWFTARVEREQSMFTRIPGWNDHMDER